MAKSGKTVLVTAGFGNQAKLVIPRLSEAGFRVRAMRAADRPGPGPKDLGADEVVFGDASNPNDAFQAMQGVDAVYHIGPTFHQREREMGVNMIEQAKRAGVEHFIFSSVLHPILTGIPQHKIKRDIEEHLLQSRLNFTILQPSDYMQMTAQSVVPDQSLYMLSYEVDNVEALVDLNDVAEVLVKVVREGPLHYGATYELSSDENLTAPDIAESLSQAFGRTFTVQKHQVSLEPPSVRFYEVDEAHSRHQMRTLRVVHNWYDTYDFVGNGNVLRMLLGRDPTSFADFARKHFGLKG